MKIRQYRPFFLGLLYFVLAAGCAALALTHAAQPKYLAGALLLLTMGGVNLWFAVSKNGIEQEIGGAVDERALFIATKSGHATTRIMNTALFSGAMLAFMVYSFTKATVYMAVGLTLAAVLAVMFLALLGANLYYERRF